MYLLWPSGQEPKAYRQLEYVGYLILSLSCIKNCLSCFQRSPSVNILYNCSRRRRCSESQSLQIVQLVNALYLFISMTETQAIWSFYYLIINFVHMLKVTCSYTGSLDVSTIELSFSFHPNLVKSWSYGKFHCWICIQINNFFPLAAHAWSSLFW